MKLGIMQPYFFPHLAYFDLINYTDQWIVFDNVKYIRHGWINRNRIHHPTKGWQYVVVPLLKHDSQARICDIRINHDLNWQQKILGQFQHYKRHSPFFGQTYELVDECFQAADGSLSQLNLIILEKVSKYLGLVFNYEYFSKMDLKLEPIEGPGDWALNISLAIGASTYVNPPGGRELFDPVHFEERGISLEIREIPPMIYNCSPYEHISRLSIVDVLMWNSPESVKEYLHQHRHSQE